MKTYISMLRGINVSGKNLIKMDTLQEMFKNLGYKNIKTFIQSGNVIFQSEEEDISALTSKISLTIQEVFSLNIPVLVKEKSELADIYTENPFLKDTADKNDENQYICLLSNVVDSQLIEKIDVSKYLPDAFCLKEDVIYIYCQNGYGQTKLNNNFFENKLKVSATTRNLKTIKTLINMCESL
ncbi:MAG: DUF1697 domain-containing protein [Bacteroidales bacterium]